MTASNGRDERHEPAHPEKHASRPEEHASHPEKRAAHPEKHAGHPEERAGMARVARAVRAASTPELCTGAARRIADGAWERAQAAPRVAPSRSFLSALPASVHPSTIRRWAIAAVAVIAVGIGAYTLRPSEPAFAIDGDPVQVLRGDRWVNESRSVRPGATVFVANGSRTLRGPGAEIVPEPGSTFRIVSEPGTTRFRIEILGGGAEVSGNSVHLAMADMDIRPNLARGAVRVFASVPPALAGVPTQQLNTSSERLTHARIEIRLGEARLSRLSTGEHLVLSGEDKAALLPVATEGARVFRLGRVREYTSRVAMHIAMGHPVIQMHETGAGTIAVLGGPDDAVTGFTITNRELPFALDDMHSAMMTLASRLHTTDLDFAPPGTAITWGDASATIDTLAADARQTMTELVHEVHGREHRVIVSGDGTVVVEHVGGDKATYASLESARENDPEAVAPLAAFLRRE
jgi:hypothetical protein